jgi:hypothetical protein
VLKPSLTRKRMTFSTIQCVDMSPGNSVPCDRQNRLPNLRAATVEHTDFSFPEIARSGTGDRILNGHSRSAFSPPLTKGISTCRTDAGWMRGIARTTLAGGI